MTHPKEGVPLTGPEFHTYFEQFAVLAKGSNVPREFLGAFRSVRAVTLSDVDIQPTQYQRMSERLLGTGFASPARAEYGLTYCTTIAAFKTYDYVQTEAAPFHTAYKRDLDGYTGFMDRIRTRYGGTPEEVAARIESSPILSGGHEAYRAALDEATSNLHVAQHVEHESKRAAELATRAFTGLETRLLRPDSSTLTGTLRRAPLAGRLFGTLTADDLLEVRDQVETYFSDSKNLAKILLI